VCLTSVHAGMDDVENNEKAYYPEILNAGLNGIEAHHNTGLNGIEVQMPNGADPYM